MPSIQGLSKKAANYRPAQTPSARCQECKYMWPKLSVGGCRYVRGVIHADDVCNEFAPERPTDLTGTAPDFSACVGLTGIDNAIFVTRRCSR